MLEIEKANEFARRFFNETAGVGLDDVEAAIRKQDNSLREERIFFGLDDRWLVQQCGHYLLYGSEYILSIAAELTRTFGEEIDYRRFLKRRGNPTVVVCNVPSSTIRGSVVFELAGAMLKNIFQDLVEPDRQDEPIDFGFDIFEALPPECIVKFLHPVEIRDPFHLD